MLHALSSIKCFEDHRAFKRYSIDRTICTKRFMLRLNQSIANSLKLAALQPGASGIRGGASYLDGIKQ